MLEIQNVSKSFDGRIVLHPTNLFVEAGRTTVLIGPSGCGKSTILRLMIGLLDPDTGVVSLDGVPFSHDNLSEMRKRIGYVIQDGGLFPHLSAGQNVSLMAKFLGWSDQQINSRLEELAELTRLPLDTLDRFPAQISGGQRQRVGIMRGLMLDPDILLLDEPMGALDPLVRFDLQEDLRNIFQTLNKTVVLVTHDMGEAGFFGDTVVLLGEGRIMQQGRIEEFLDAPADEFVTRFLNAQRSLVGP